MRSVRAVVLPIVVLCAIALVAFGYAARWRAEARPSHIDTTVGLDRNATVDLGLVAGRITVRGWSQPQAKISAASDRDPIEFEHGSDRIVLRLHRRFFHFFVSWNDGSAVYDLTVPYGARVVMRSVSGDLHALDVKGPCEAHTVSGQVEVADATGDATVRSVSGDVDLQGADGRVNVSSVSGSISLSAVHGDVDASTTSGSITASQAQSPKVHMKSVSGSLSYGGTIDSVGLYDFRSVSGDVKLNLASDARATVNLRTLSGSIGSDFPFTATGPVPQHHIVATIGRGGGRIDADALSGSIELKKAISST